MRLGIGWIATFLLVGVMGMVAACGGDGENATDDADTPTTAATDDDAASAADGTLTTLTWTNDPARLVDQKAANFVPFTFRYPASWRVVEDGSQPDAESPNFVKVENSTPDNITIENFAVGWYSGTGAAEVIALIEPQFATSFPNYAKVGDRTWTIDGIESPGVLFQARVDAPSGPVPFFGRIMAVPVDASHGLMIVLFASDRAEGVEGPEDAGEEGEIPVILESFDIPR